MKHFLICATLMVFGPAVRGMDAELEFFEKKIRPLFATHCIACHGEKKQKGGLRLDSREAAIKGGDTGPVFVAKDPSKSLLNQVVSYVGEIKMPPTGKLSDDDLAALNQWVKNGAAWPAGGAGSSNDPKAFDLRERAQHWSFQPVKITSIPKINGVGTAINPVDAFILAKLQQRGLRGAAKADKRTLLRRVTFDLTGLPPTPDEIDQFVKDDSPLAWERVLDRLLASKAYGERYARHWLDLVRYAETQGHEFDFELFEAWRYRDYVIRAINTDVPYDQFVREHVAGDLLPKPRKSPVDGSNESVQATGFWFLGEAKHSPVDVRVDQADRMDNEIDVFAKTFLGLTVSCARCHDHKFDAITTRDYYSLFGILTSSRHDRAFIDDPDQRAKWLNPLTQAARDLEAKAIDRTVDGLKKQLSEKGLSGIAGGTPAWNEFVALAGLSPEKFKQQVTLLRKKYEQESKALAAWTNQANALPMTRSGWTSGGEAFSTHQPRAMLTEDGKVTGIPAPAIGRGTFSPKLTGTLRSPTFVIDRDFILYRVPGNDVRVNLVVDNFQLIQDPIYGALRFGAAGDESRWHAQNVKRWKGHRAYVEVLDDGNGKASLLDVIQVDQPNPPPVPLIKQLVGTSETNSPEEFARTLKKHITKALDRWKNANKMTDDDIRLLNMVLGTSASIPVATEEEKQLRGKMQDLERALPPARRALAITDGTGLNERVFIRGSHKNPGEEAPRRLLEVIDPTPFKIGSGRLELASKLTDGTNPLTARVMVNRIWMHHFSEGIVRTPDDFGRQGQPPTHPELLDWLAGWFVENGWSVKKLHKLILMSATYQQASDAPPKSDQVDPKNELFHKMPVRRLEAEAIRDSLLSVSGRLDPATEGPPIPTHLTSFMIGRGRPGVSGPLDGAGRRSIYLQVRRNFLNPFMLAFDYPVPFTAIGHRGSSNVPAQALAMLNNPLVNQQAELWAKRILSSNSSAEERIDRMYLMAFGRPANPEEIGDGKSFVNAQLAEYGRGNEARAWTDFAHVLVNLKEFIFVR